MDRIAMDHPGDVLLGHSVVNGVDVYPGIRYTGRMSGTTRLTVSWLPNVSSIPNSGMSGFRWDSCHSAHYFQVLFCCAIGYEEH